MPDRPASSVRPLAPTRIAIRLALVLAASTVAVEPLLVRTWGSRAPTWSHWWCSASSARSAPHRAGADGLGAAVLTPIKALAPHWPHFLPILLGLATLVYLWRADVRYRVQEGQARAAASLPAGQGSGLRAPDGRPSASSNVRSGAPRWRR